MTREEEERQGNTHFCGHFIWPVSPNAQHGSACTFLKPNTFGDAFLRKLCVFTLAFLQSPHPQDQLADTSARPY